MHKTSAPMLLCVGLLIAGCGGKSTERAAGDIPAAPQVYGYQLKDGNVVFEFVPGQYESADSALGRTAAVAGLDIQQAYVAGDFNEWSMTAWAMSREPGSGPPRFTLVKAPAELGTAKEYRFKFVANGAWWIEPRQTRPTVNSTSTTRII